MLGYLTFTEAWGNVPILFLLNAVANFRFESLALWPHFFGLGSLILPRFLTKVGQIALNHAFKVLSAVYKPSTWRICVSTAISEVCPLYVCQRSVKSAIILISVLRYSLAHLRASNILIVSIQYINSRTSNHLKIFNY